MSTPFLLSWFFWGHVLYLRFLSSLRVTHSFILASLTDSTFWLSDPLLKTLKIILAHITLLSSFCLWQPEERTTLIPVRPSKCSQEQQKTKNKMTKEERKRYKGMTMRAKSHKYIQVLRRQRWPGNAWELIIFKIILNNKHLIF